MSTHRLSAGLLGLVGVLSASACTSSTYLRATRPYAEAIAAGTAAFVEELELAGAMCQHRIEIDQLRHLLEGSTNQIIQWEAHCEQIALATKVQRRAAVLLLAYAQALQQLADGVTYQGTGLGDAAGGTADLIRRFAGATSPEAAYASALGPPLTQLAAFLLTQSTSLEIKRRIDESAPAVEAMLGAMAAYVKATDAQLLVYEHEVTKLLADAEARLRVDPQAGGKPESLSQGPADGGLRLRARGRWAQGESFNQPPEAGGPHRGHREPVGSRSQTQASRRARRRGAQAGGDRCGQCRPSHSRLHQHPIPQGVAMQVQALRRLLELSDALSDIIMNERPGKTVTEESFRALVARRDRITVALNTLIGNGFEATTKQIEQFVTQLEDITAQLVKAKDTVQAVKKGFELAGQALTALAKVVAFLV